MQQIRKKDEKGQRKSWEYNAIVDENHTESRKCNKQAKRKTVVQKERRNERMNE